MERQPHLFNAVELSCRAQEFLRHIAGFHPHVRIRRSVAHRAADLHMELDCLDDQLKRFLEGHDERYWTDTVRRLTYEAIRLLAKYGFGGGNYADRAAEYALDAVGEVFARAAKDAPTMFDLSKGDQSRPADDRFWTYMVFNCLRPLITRDAERWKSRSRWPSVPLGEAHEVPAEVADCAEAEAESLIEQLTHAADGDLRRLLVAARTQFDDEPNRTDVNWKEIQRTLGISRYACDALRRELNSLRLSVLGSNGVASLTHRKR